MPIINNMCYIEPKFLIGKQFKPNSTNSNQERLWTCIGYRTETDTGILHIIGMDSNSPANHPPAYFIYPFTYNEVRFLSPP